MNKLAVLAFTLLMFFSTMLWYLADGSLNDYLKSQIVLQGQYYSGQETRLEKATFDTNSGVLTLKKLALVDTKSAKENNKVGYQESNKESNKEKNILTIDEVVVQLAHVQAPEQPQKSNSDLSKTVQHITADSVTVNKLTINLNEVISDKTSGKFTKALNSLAILQQRISLKLATDYPALYPDIAAKIYAEQHPELNAALVTTHQENTKTNHLAETNQAVIESKAAKQKKRLLGKATTRITLLSFTINTLEIRYIAEDGTMIIKNFSKVALPSIGNKDGLASNQIGGEVLRLLLDTIKVL